MQHLIRSYVKLFVRQLMVRNNISLTANPFTTDLDKEGASQGVQLIERSEEGNDFIDNIELYFLIDLRIFLIL